MGNTAAASSSLNGDGLEADLISERGEELPPIFHGEGDDRWDDPLVPPPDDDEVRASPDEVRRGRLQAALCIVLFLLIAGGALAGYFLSNDGAEPFRVAKFTPPPAYQLSLTLALPYSGLSEPCVAMVDTVKGASRLSYYSGMSFFITNASGVSYSVLPVIDKHLVFVDEKPVDLPPLFPDLRLFSLADGGSTTSVRGEACHKFTFSAGHPGEDGYLGTYTWWQTESTARPIRFAFVGHNVLLDGSHFDEYVVDYHELIDLGGAGVDPFWLRPPRDMPHAGSSSDPSGPKGQLLLAGATAREHVAQLRRLFPSRSLAEDLDASFDAFTALHNKVYPSDTARSRAAAAFHANARYIASRNREGNRRYTLALNHLADLNPSELARLRGSRGAALTAPGQGLGGDGGGYPLPSYRRECKTISMLNVKRLMNRTGNSGGVGLPRELDLKPFSSPPGDQGTCGSCWAFGATGAIAGAVAFARNASGTPPSAASPPLVLSPQNMMDCSWGYDNQACDGGLAYRGFEWLLEHNDGRIATEATYPYLNQDSFCHYDELLGLEDSNVETAAPARLLDCAHITEQWNSTTAESLQPDQLELALRYFLSQVGPVVVSINASQPDFYFYAEGVYDAECAGDTDSLDHSVLGVGYGETESGQRYWTIKNSWSTHWGEGGYARIASKDNTCGVATAAAYAVVSS